MKKFAILILAIIGINALMAQPTPPRRPINFATNYGQSSSNVRNPANAPITPATLLSLGLGGATVGTMVIRNTNKKGGK